jgi:hypothetical protein
VLSVSRWYFRDRPGEVYRMTALASAALMKLGVANPQAHMAIVRSTLGQAGMEGPDGVGTLLVSPTPFSDADMATLKAAADRLRFDTVLTPTFAADDTFVTLASGRNLDEFTARYPINIAPPTDDSPFFFNMLRLRDVLQLDLIQHGKSTHNMEAVFVLGTLLFTVFLLTSLCIVLPLVVTTDRRALQGSLPLVLFFAAIGLGFMLVETSQMQRLIVVLGHPTYGLTVVLFSLLLASGLGSWLTTKMRDLAGRSGLLVIGALVVVLFAFGLVTPALAHRIEGAGTSVRIVVSALVLAMPGVLMGMAFPLGMRLSNDRAALTPWLWGVNGATSVCASVLAVAIALSTTISMAFWAGWLCYAAALGAFAWQLRRARVSDLEQTVVDEPVRASAAV